MTGAELMQGLARGTQVAATMSIFGSIWFQTILLGSAPASESAASATMLAPVKRHITRLTGISLALAFLAAIAWLLTQAAALADEPGLSQIAATIPIVLWQTHFGPLLMARLTLLVIACLLFLHGGSRASHLLATFLAGSAVLLQIGFGHGLSMAGADRLILISAEAGHLVAAAIWLGGLLPLLFLVRALPPASAHDSLRRFSRMAVLCVSVLVLTIIVQSWFLIGGLPGFIGTDYGLTALLKGLCFLALLGCAALNRWRFTPKLVTAQASHAERYLRRSIALETVIGLIVVLAAGALLSLAPAVHQQPNWPFPYQLSLETTLDPDLRNEVLLGATQAIAAFACLCLVLLWRRGRWPMLAAALVLAWFAAPHLSLLLAPAYPTSFYTSPTGFTGASIVNGARLFAANCTACHGTEGRGDGPQAKALPIAPADLTAAHLFGHSDGELFWWLSHGIDGPTGGLVMPGFADQLEEDERWALIDYIRAHNAGLAMQGTGQWPQPMRAPDMTARVDNATVPLSNLHGHFLLLTAMNSASLPITIATGDMPPLTSIAIEPDSDAWKAYAIIAGVTPDHLAGTQFLVDDAGWLRSVLYPATTGAPVDQDSILGALHQAMMNPIDAAAAGHHHM